MAVSAMNVGQWKALIKAQIDELREISEQSSESRKPVELDQTVQGRLSRMDAMQGQAMAQATEARRRQQIQALQGALKRIDRGEFGECLECGEPIAEKRLHSNPAIMLCIECASARE